MRFHKRIKRFSKEEQGASAVLVAFMMIIILGFVAMAVDYGLVYYRKSQLQIAIDAAAQAASRSIADDAINPIEERERKTRQAAIFYLEQNGFPQSELSKCDIDASVEDGVSIDVESDVNMTFARIFGRDTTNISAATTAITEYHVTGGKKVTVDVAFVLDISGSMYNNNQAKNKLVAMIDSVNSAIDSILKENSENRVSIIVFSGSDATKTILELKSDPSTVSSVTVDKYVKVGSGRGSYYEWRKYTYDYQEPTATAPVYIGYNLNSTRSSDIWPIYIGTSDSYIEISESGGTFTQMGIYEGSKTLMESYDDGVTRVPAVFVMSDGEATFGQTSYNNNIRTSNVGNGNAVSTAYSGKLDEVGYYTILTANYWKRKLTSEYTIRNDQETDARFYSLGFKLDVTDYPDYAAAVLNPDTLAGIGRRASKPAKDLKSKLENSGNPYRNDYFYANQYYEATGVAELQNVLLDFASDVVLPTKTYSTRLTK